RASAARRRVVSHLHAPPVGKRLAAPGNGDTSAAAALEGRDDDCFTRPVVRTRPRRFAPAAAARAGPPDPAPTGAAPAPGRAGPARPALSSSVSPRASGERSQRSPEARG